MTDQQLNNLRQIRIHKILGVRDDGRMIQTKCMMPNHRDGSPSFTLYPANDFFCFGCNSTGQGAIDFVMALGFSFEEAIKELESLSPS